MATPNQLPLGGNRVFLTGSSFNRKTYQQAGMTVPVQQPDSWEQIPGWLKSRGSVLPDDDLMETKELPSIMILLNEGETASALRRTLDSCPLQIQSLGSCREAADRLAQQHSPVTIFTDVRLPDGDWKQVLRIARQAPVTAEVIVVSRVVDVHLYLDTLDAGAFDFVVPPFCAADLNYIIFNAFRACLNHQPILARVGR